LAHHLLERGAPRSGGGKRLVALLADTIRGDLAGTRLAVDHSETIARLGRLGKAKDLYRSRRPGLPALGAMIIDQRADTAPCGAGDDDVADRERACLDEHGGNRAAAPV